MPLILMGLAAMGAMASCAATEPAAGAPAAREQAESPTQPVAVVRRMEFQIVYQLDGVSAVGSSMALVADPALDLQVAVADGDVVSAGDLLGSLVIRPDVEAALEVGAQTSRLDEVSLDRLLQMQSQVYAPVPGTLDTSGDAAVLRTAGVDVIVDLNPIQELRLRSIPFTGLATIETVIGRRTVDCETTWIERGVAAQDDSSEERGSIRCRLPSRVETTDGLRAHLVLSSQTIPDAVVVPNLYLGYDAQADGYEVTIVESGTERTVPVDVGPTDGVVRVITSALPVGAQLVLPEDADR